MQFMHEHKGLGEKNEGITSYLVVHNFGRLSNNRLSKAIDV